MVASTNQEIYERDLHLRKMQAEVEKLVMDTFKTHAEYQAINARLAPEVDKIVAERKKLERERWWHPLP